MAVAVRFRSAVALAGSYPVLAGVDLDVARGEVVLLRGPNGAGKTSLLRTCAGLLPLAGGEGCVLGVDLANGDIRALRRRVGLLAHTTGLYDDLTVEDNVRFAVRAAGRRASAAGPALKRLGLDGRLRRVPAGRLSAGQRRRTALAGLVAREPELWLLDEPHAGLDAEGRDELDAIIASAVAEGATVVFASHEADRADRLARRCVTIAGGATTGGLLEPSAPTPGPASAAGPAAVERGASPTGAIHVA